MRLEHGADVAVEGDPHADWQVDDPPTFEFDGRTWVRLARWDEAKQRRITASFLRRDVALRAGS